MEKPRTMEDIQKDYSHQASIAGQTQYQIRTLQGDLSRMNRKMRELNKEAVALQAAQQPPVEASKVEEQSNG